MSGYRISEDGERCVNENIPRYGGTQEPQYNPAEVYPINDDSNYSAPVSSKSLLPPDVSENDWFADTIRDFVFSKHIDVKRPFRPADMATRAEFIKLIVELRGGISLDYGADEPTFTDVSPSDPYFEYFEHAMVIGLIQGKGNCFLQEYCNANPYGLLNRAEAATIIIRAFDLEQSVNTPSFEDVEDDAWYIDAINRTAAHCILQGDAGTARVRPSDTMNRAEMVVMLSRVNQGLQYPNCQ